MVTIVVGGSGGLGVAICDRVAAAGRDVYLTYNRRRDAAEAVVEKLSAYGVRAACGRVDLGVPDDIEAALDAAGAVDAVVYAAGPAIPQQWLSATSREDWRAFVASEIDGFFNLTHAALPRLRDAGKAALVAVTSFATTRVIPGDGLSAVPKAAIEMLVRQIAREEGRYGLRANCVSPGIIDAGLGRKAQEDHYTPDIWEERRRAVPLRRFGEARAIADAVVFLLSDAAGYVTGQTITVDGGLSV